MDADYCVLVAATQAVKDEHLKAALGSLSGLERLMVAAEDNCLTLMIFVTRQAAMDALETLQTTPRHVEGVTLSALKATRTRIEALGQLRSIPIPVLASTRRLQLMASGLKQIIPPDGIKIPNPADGNPAGSGFVYDPASRLWYSSIAETYYDASANFYGQNTSEGQRVFTFDTIVREFWEFPTSAAQATGGSSSPSALKVSGNGAQSQPVSFTVGSAPVGYVGKAMNAPLNLRVEVNDLEESHDDHEHTQPSSDFWLDHDSGICWLCRRRIPNEKLLREHGAQSRLHAKNMDMLARKETPPHLFAIVDR